MKKKEYQKPSMSVIKLNSNQPLLTGSIQSMQEQTLFEEEEVTLEP